MYYILATFALFGFGVAGVFSILKSFQINCPYKSLALEAVGILSLVFAIVPVTYLAKFLVL